MNMAGENILHITGVDHIALDVINMDESIQFYCDVLGFEKLNTVVTAECITTFIRLPSGVKFELVKTLVQNHTGRLTKPELAFKHVAFSATQISQGEKYLLDAGVEVIVSCTDLAIFSSRVIQFKDPNGHILALTENIG
jgi:catechol 2,3-dioxygenase-like lactoylglutathione lyase family enzyme